MNYKVISRVKMFSKPGISPTVKDGNDVGYSIIGDTFSSTRNVNGWLAVNDANNKWIQASACDEATVTPPPEPSLRRFQMRDVFDNGTVGEWKQFIEEL